MRHRINRIAGLSIGTLVLLTLSSCDADDTKWEVGREAVGGIEANRERVDAEWSLFRDDLVRALDQMDASLHVAAGAASVVDQKEIQDLQAHIKTVREDVVALVDQPHERVLDARTQARKEFEQTRTKVDALLTRLGHNPDDIARWQDPR